MGKVKTKWVVLDLIVEEVLSSGVCPTAGRVCVLSAPLPGSTTRSAIAALLRSGHIVQAAGHGSPLRPVLDSDDVPVVIDARREHP